ncbi:MAG: Fic family protein [Bryobacterales bacterium]|nr:Fic family protein [Bryobacterales bacterium]
MKADIDAPDREEIVTLMEPLLLGERFRHRGRITDLALDLAEQSSALRSSLREGLLSPLAALARSMNCYYSNLIEGHNTHPVEIERALQGDLSHDARRRNLQLEAKAHIEVQQWIDEGGLTAAQAITTDGIREIHRRFCELLPPELLLVEDPATKARLPVIPGELRIRDVQVGQHVAISPGAVPRFLTRFTSIYGKLGKSESIIAAAAAHHRLLWIHPFLDGNGRVARLMSHAQLRDLLHTGSVWSVARGLARNVADYKLLLAGCDMPRRNHLDGRGSLSEEALGEFIEFFLQVCLDQIRFMRRLLQPDLLQTRIRLWTEEEIRLGTLPSKSGMILDAILYRGTLPRGEVESIVGTGDRQARRIVAALVDRGAVQSDSPRASLRLAFPATLASRWLPGLFPELPD